MEWVLCGNKVLLGNDEVMGKEDWGIMYKRVMWKDEWW